MQMTAVYSCVRILSEAVVSLPLHVYKYNGDGGKEKAVKHPLYFLLHDEPNPEMISFVFRETLMTHLLLWGNAYAQIIRNGKGEIISLILSRLVDTFFSRISLTKPPASKSHNTAYVLPWEEPLHWQSRSSGCSSS